MVKKEKNLSLKREFSAGGIVYKRFRDAKDKAQIKWLIVKPQGTDRWQFPKGKIDEGESSKDTAVREVKEEAGVEAKIITKVGNSQYFFVLGSEKIYKHVTFFLMEYVNDTKLGHDNEVDEVKFLPFDKAVHNLTFKGDKELLIKARELLESGNQSSLV
jgi:8-oxo-dGTP pyrophosphatase MutT (NUDIX family)